MEPQRAGGALCSVLNAVLNIPTIRSFAESVVGPLQESSRPAQRQRLLNRTPVLFW
jgi:hypothetical protein